MYPVPVPKAQNPPLLWNVHCSCYLEKQEMVSTRSVRRRKEMANASVETYPVIDITDQGHPRRCSETVPHPFPSLTSPLRSPLGNIKKIHCSSSILRPAKRSLLNEPLPIPQPQHETSIPITNPDHIPTVSTGVEEMSSTSHVGKTSQCTSFNFTEYARGLEDDTDDDDISPLDPAFVFVNGHRVKKDNGPLLSAIFEKYGDITTESKDKPPAIVSLFLERTCAIFGTLKERKFSNITLKDVNEMLDEVRFMESQKLNLSWLRERLENIHDTKTRFHDYLSVKEEMKRNEMMIAKLRYELSLVEEKLVAEMAKGDEMKKITHDIRAGVDPLLTHSLVHGLL